MRPLLSPVASGHFIMSLHNFPQTGPSLLFCVFCCTYCRLSLNGATLGPVKTTEANKFIVLHVIDFQLPAIAVAHVYKVKSEIILCNRVIILQRIVSI